MTDDTDANHMVDLENCPESGGGVDNGDGAVSLRDSLIASLSYTQGVNHSLTEFYSPTQNHRIAEGVCRQNGK